MFSLNTLRHSRRLRHRLVPGLMAIPLLVAILGMVLTDTATAQSVEPLPGTRSEALGDLARRLQAREAARRTSLYFDLLQRRSGPQAVLNRDDALHLVGTEKGRPLFYATHNLNAARTVGADRLWPGGVTGFDLAGANQLGELAIWDAGAVLTTHQEFGGRAVVWDGATGVHYHATHVAGTMVAQGVDADAHGMSPAAYLASYDWDSDESEMAAAAAGGLLVSNHSYGWATGWYWSSADSVWFWFGDTAVSEVEDAGFGAYVYGCQEIDQIAFDAPYYLMVKSAGNDRNDTGPEPGGEHYVWNEALGDYELSTTTRDPDGGLSGYDTVPYRGGCKNILTVGAVDDIPGGWTAPTDVVMSSFSGWGPTDDGRIKPDLVANGIALYSCYIDSDESYVQMSGTSMAAPNASGTMNLLAQHYRATHAGQTARAATLKSIVLHTAHEAGPADGPDYAHGWGLLDAEAAAELIADDVVFPARVAEHELADGQPDSVLVYSAGDLPLAATICWTDPPGTPPVWSVDAPDLLLVNDLDLRLERVADGTSYAPWVLDPANPSWSATTGDNFRDNVEKVQVAAPTAGLYRVIVGHKASLAGATQAYSLVLSGFSDQPQAPVVTGVQFTQLTDGSGRVHVSYDLSDGDSSMVSVTLTASSDGGATWDLDVTSVSGDVGANVTVGDDRLIVWDFAADNPDRFLPNVVLRVEADDGG